MNTFSEKSMEDAIENNPEKFINEKGLRLLARQYRAGSYIFDLLFEDRHGGKLIVEIQKGTLDRTHTYKILDYYHEYKEKNPRDFIDVMVIANVIPPERKRRLNDLGIEYKEISESIFIIDQSKQISENEAKAVSLVIQNSKKVKILAKRKSLGPSQFIIMTVEGLKKEDNSSKWDINKKGMNGCLIAKHKSTIDKINKEFDAQIWMERPKERKNGERYARCKFEVATTRPSSSNPLSEESRKKIADSLRNYFMTFTLPEGVEKATGSTVIAMNINLSENPTDDKNKISKIIVFYKFLDEKLNGWNYSD